MPRKIDPNTGLPVIPWGDKYFWRVRKAGLGYNFHYLQLRKRCLWWSDEIVEKAVHHISDYELQRVAHTILDTLTNNDTDRYVGDYPPKKVGSK